MEMSQNRHIAAERIVSLPKKKKKKEKSWITKDILDFMDLRKQNKGSPVYHELDK